MAVRQLEQRLRDLQHAVDRNYRATETIGSWARNVWSETVERVRASLERLQEATPLLRSIGAAPRKAATVIGTLLVGGYAARSSIYEKVADESEKLGKEVLERNVKNVITTLDGVAKDPQTLALLVVLLQQLLEDASTRANLVALVSNLLQTPSIQQDLVALLFELFADEELKLAVGTWALEALDTEDARRMLDTQVARLTTATVLDDQVQRDAGTGVRRAIKNAILFRK